VFNVLGLKFLKFAYLWEPFCLPLSR